MSLRLPTADDSRRDFIDIAYLAEMGATKRFPTFREALSSARRTVAADFTIREAHSICMRADGEVWLIRVGIKGGWRKVWNFGKLH